MKFILIVMVLGANAEVSIFTPQVFERMDKCMLERELAVLEIGRPIINYQAICLRYDPARYPKK